MRAGLAMLLLLGACSQNSADTAVVEDSGPMLPKRVTLTIKAPPGQLVQTVDGLWLRAQPGTKEAPIQLREGPASIAERGFFKSWVGHPNCAVEPQVKSLKLSGIGGWIDQVELRCPGQWFGVLHFDLTIIVERQIEALRGADDPRRRLGLEPEAEDKPEGWKAP